MILTLTAGLVSSKKDVFMPEGQVFPEDIPVGDDFIDSNFDLFERNIKSGKAVTDHYKDLNNYLTKIQTVNYKFALEMKFIRRMFARIARKLISGDREADLIDMQREEATDRVEKFKRNTRKWSVVFDTAIKWIEKRVVLYSNGKSKDELIEIQKLLIESQGNLSQVLKNLKALNEKLNECDPERVYYVNDFDPYFVILINDWKYNFHEMTHMALEKIQRLMLEPDSSLIQH